MRLLLCGLRQFSRSSGAPKTVAASNASLLEAFSHVIDSSKRQNDRSLQSGGVSLDALKAAPEFDLVCLKETDLGPPATRKFSPGDVPRGPL